MPSPRPTYAQIPERGTAPAPRPWKEYKPRPLPNNIAERIREYRAIPSRGNK